MCKLVSVTLSLALLPCALAGAPADAARESPRGGAVVEEIAPGSAAARAGLAPGDLLLAWERAASPPANPRPAAGTIGSPFDLVEVEIEEAPRGAFRLTGRREGETRSWEMPPDDWGLTAAPRFQGSSQREYGRGRSEIAAGRTTRGIARWQRLAAALASGGEPERAAWLYGQAAAAEAKRGSWGEARATYERALATVGGRSTLPVVSKLRLDLARTLREMGQFSPAADLLQKTLDARRARVPESLYEAEILRYLGRVSVLQGEPRKAEGQLSRALALQQRLAPESLGEARALKNLGIAERHLGHFSSAEELERRALALDERLLPASLEVATDYVNLGNLLGDRGDFTAAADSFRQALALRERLAPGSLAVADALQALGAVLLKGDDPAGAAAAFRRALATVEGLHTPELSRVDHLLGLGTALWAQHQYPEAESWLRRLLAIHERNDPGSVDSALTLNNLADVLLDEGRLAEAEASCRRALAILRELEPESAREATGSRDLAVIVRRAGRPGEARDLYGSALASLEASGRNLGGASQTRSAFLGRYAPYYREAVDLLLELGRPEEAFGVLEHYRAQGFLALLAERDLAFDDVPAELERERQSANSLYDRLHGQLATLSAHGPTREREQLQRQLAEVRLRQEGIRARIRAASPRLATLRDPEPLGLAETAKALDPGTLLLSYSVGKERSWLFAVGPEPGRFAVHSIALGEEALRAEVGRLRTLIEQGGTAATSEAVLRRAASLTDRLLRPAAREVAAARRLLVLPDGPLHLLPFALLGEPGATAPPRFLVEEKPVFTAASATVFASLAKTRRDRGPVHLSAFGDPAYPAQTGAAAGEPALKSALRRGLRFDPLPGTRTEVLALRTLFPAGAEVFLGPEATEERAKALGREASIVHFACHALLDERSPLDSGLALSIPEKPREGQDNGLLQAWEIFEQVHLDADLVTLSACESALGKEQGGEGLLGLSRGFQYAGARSVVASLWGVGDTGTAELMRRFYGYLKAGESKGEALRHAQVDLLRGAAGEDLKLPFHWAAFELTGDWR
jgi:CHAT domain-containing protein/Tfp pilus assembly protein PilF